MNKKKQKEQLENYKIALETILAVWEKPVCLHTCRWGSETVGICIDALAKNKEKQDESR